MKREPRALAKSQDLGLIPADDEFVPGVGACSTDYDTPVERISGFHQDGEGYCRSRRKAGTTSKGFTACD